MRRAKFWLGGALGGLVLTVAVGAVWGLLSYVGLLRLQVELQDACSRVDAASRSRSELVTNLIHGSRSFGDPAGQGVARLAPAAARAAEPILAGHLLTDPERYEAFLAAQRELTRALDVLWDDVRARPAPGARLLVEDFESELRRSSAQLAVGLERLDRTVSAYREATGRFPASMVAGFSAASGRSD